MKLLNIILPVVLLKKIYGRGFEKKSDASSLSEDEQDRLQDLKDDQG